MKVQASKPKSKQQRAIQQQKNYQLAAFGSHLRDERIKQGRSIYRVAKTLAITREQLSALEVWHDDLLPAEAYRVGLLNAYADILGVRPISPKGVMRSPILSISRNRDTKVLSRWIAGGLVAVVSLILLGYLSWISRSLFAQPSIVLEQPAEQVITANQVTISGWTDRQTIVRVDGQPVGVDESGKFSTIVGIRSGQNDITITAFNSLGRQNTQVRSVYK